MNKIMVKSIKKEEAVVLTNTIFQRDLPSVRLACELRRSRHVSAGLARVPRGFRAASNAARADITPAITSLAHSGSSSGMVKEGINTEEE